MNTRSTSLADAFEHFLEASSFARRTRESYTEDLAPLLAVIGQQPVTALTTEVVQSFLAHQEVLSPATYNRRLAALRSFTRWLSDQGWDTSALLDGRARKLEGRRAARALDAQKVESVLRKIEDPRDRALFWLIYDGGLRSQEALFIDAHRQIVMTCFFVPNKRRESVANPSMFCVNFCTTSPNIAL